MKVLLQLYASWFKMGLFTFGGGYAMLPMIQKEVIEKYHWASEEEVMDYYAIGQCTPGIIAVNTATFIGYSIKGIIGGIVSTLGIVSPGLIIIMIIASAINNFQDLQVVQNALSGIRVAVCYLMITSIYKLFRSSVKDVSGLTIFIVALVLSCFTNLSLIFLVLLAAISGIVIMKIRGQKV